MPDTAYLIALLQARADDDADSVAELVDILRGDPEEAEALLEEARGGGVYGKSSKWDESKHPRADDGKFGSGRGGGAGRHPRAAVAAPRLDMDDTGRRLHTRRVTLGGSASLHMCSCDAVL